MDYATSLRNLDRSVGAALSQSQTDSRVSVEEYRELADMQKRAAKLKHRQWQRETFPSNNPPERTSA